MREQILSAEAERDLATIGRIKSVIRPEVMTEDLPELLEGAAVCVTGWGTPPLGEELLVDHPTLRLVAHTAGSIRRLVPLGVMQRGLRVSHAAAVIADAVAEFVISQALLGLRQLHEIDRSMKAGGEWKELRERYLGRLLGAQTVGVVGAGYVGRSVIHLFKAFGSPILVYDPVLSEEGAETLGVELRPLDDVFRASHIVTIHAPLLPETHRMIGSTQLALLRDGALFINTARAALIDETALLRELRTGRLVAALDVFEQEPLSAESPFRVLPNVILSPHAAGHTIDTYHQQGQAMVDEVRRLTRGEPLRYEITPEMLKAMA